MSIVAEDERKLNRKMNSAGDHSELKSESTRWNSEGV